VQEGRLNCYPYTFGVAEVAMKFTSKGIAALKPKSERYEVWESGRTGFGLRVTPKG